MNTAEDRVRGTNRPLVTMNRPDNGLPEDLREHARLMCDIIALAFQTDKTRIASLLLARDLSSLYYPFLNVSVGHHNASHNDTSSTTTNASPASTSANWPIWRKSSKPCPKATAPCSTIAA